MGGRGAMHQTAFLLFCPLTEVRLDEFRGCREERQTAS
jgi:hypothetical protein